MDMRAQQYILIRNEVTTTVVDRLLVASAQDRRGRDGHGPDTGGKEEQFWPDRQTDSHPSLTGCNFKRKISHHGASMFFAFGAAVVITIPSFISSWISVTNRIALLSPAAAS